MQDVLDAAEFIEQQTAGRTFDEFLVDRLLRDAMERNIERLSDASRHISHELKSRHSEIPWRNVADIGNVPRHGYDTVNSKLIRDPIVRDLPQLQGAVRSMLKDVEGEG